MAIKNMSSETSLRVLPLIFGVSVIFFSHSIASVRNDLENNLIIQSSKTALNSTRHASIFSEAGHTKDSSVLDFKRSEAGTSTSSEKYTYSDTEMSRPIMQRPKYKRSAENLRSRNSTAGFNFLTSLFHRFSEITKSHNKMYNLRYKAENEEHIHENITTNVTTALSSPSDIQSSRVPHTNNNVSEDYTNHTNHSTASGPKLLSGQRNSMGTGGNDSKGNVETRHQLKSPRMPPVHAKNLSVNSIKDDPQKLCPNCRTRQSLEDDVVTLRTAHFKDLLLDKLRLSEKDLSVKPSRGYPKLPRDVLEKTLRDNARQEAMEEFYAQDKELILDGRDLGRKCIKSPEVTGCYLFILEGKVRGKVASAKLWLYKTPDGNDVSEQTIRIFQLEKTRRGRLRRRNLMIRQDTFVQEGWVTMNVTRSVRSWVDKRMQTAMVAIRCDTCRTHNHKALFGAKAGYRPLLIIDYDTSNLSPRKRRTIEDCDVRYECCKRNLHINFTIIGMPTILFPPTISVGYCYGRCNNSPNYMFNHTQLIQSARLSDPALNQTTRHQLEPCCIPMTFKDTFLIIYTEQGMIQTTVPNVIVDSCGCA